MSNIRLLIFNGHYSSPLILSRGSKLWTGIQIMNKLTFIDLAGSQNLTETPDFSGVPYLQHLRLCGCKSLVTIHPSLGKLKELVEVDLSSCKNLQFLPKKLETNSLMELDLSWCEKVKVLPEFGEGMEKLSFLGVEGTAITRLPESLVLLTGLGDLNLEGHKILNLEKLLKIHVTRQISSLNVMCLTELCLRLYRLLFLSLDCCERLKSLPSLPPGLIRLGAYGCNSMEPLSDRLLCDLVSSLDHEEYRGRTKYVISDTEDDDIPWELDDVEIEWLPLRDFVAIIPGSDIPSWFTNKEDYTPDIWRYKYEIKVNIPGYLRDSEWSGIVVCLLIPGPFIGLRIKWSSKAAEDDDYILKDWAHLMHVHGGDRLLCMMVLELNEETCWKHLTAHNNTLHILLANYDYDDTCKILGYGWRVMRKKRFRPNQFNQLASPPEVNLPCRVLDILFENSLDY